MATSSQKSFGLNLIEKMGYEDASIYAYGIISSKFDYNNTDILLAQMEQFIREEFDAASQGNEYSRNFVKKLVPEEEWYKGAMREEPDHPIDGEDGPQQMILGIILPLIKDDAKLAIKFRCNIVKMIFNDFEVLKSEIFNTPISPLMGNDFLKRRKKLTYLINLTSK